MALQHAIVLLQCTCLKIVQTRSYFWSVFSCIRTEISVFSRSTGKYVPEITPYLDTFHTKRFLTKIAKQRLVYDYVKDTSLDLKIQRTLSILTTLCLEYLSVLNRNLVTLDIYVALKIFFSLYLEHSLSQIFPYLE